MTTWKTQHVINAHLHHWIYIFAQLNANVHCCLASQPKHCWIAFAFPTRDSEAVYLEKHVNHAQVWSIKLQSTAEISIAIVNNQSISNKLTSFNIMTVEGHAVTVGSRNEPGSHSWAVLLHTAFVPVSVATTKLQSKTYSNTFAAWQSKRESDY